MEQRLTPQFFYGSAIAAMIGLMFGLMLHVAWRKHPGGPQILLSSAAASEPRNPALAGSGATELADRDTAHVAPNPLPVTRLAPDMFEARPAAAGEPERQDADDQVADATPQASQPGYD